MIVKKITYKNEEIFPLKPNVLKAMGMGEDVTIPEEVEALYSQAFEIFEKTISPRGIYKSISKKEFAAVYDGEGQNDPVTPLADIFPNADSLALYVFTLGEEVSDKIDELLREKDYPLGFMLDRIASESADKASGISERILNEEILSKYPGNADKKTLLYSPGYCGWHITAQKKIFNFLRPGSIGVSLNDSSLMSPIKSVSGVLLTGAPTIHVFQNNFPFCRECKTFSCRERMKSLLS